MGTAGGVIQLVTRCASAEEFIERFARYTTATEVIVPALANLTVGATGPFVICLNDRSIILKGRCEVTEIRRAPVAAGAALGPALMRLHLREMDAHSAGIHLRLMERQASAHRGPALPGVTPSPPREAVPAAAPVAADASEATVVSDAGSRSDSEPTAISARPRPEARVPGAALTLPANPLGDLDAADLASFIDLTLLETSGVDAAPAGPAAPVARVDPRLDRARRIARRLAPYAACAAVMLSLGIALGWASKAAPVAAAAVVSPPPQAAPTAAAASAAPAPPDGDPVPATRNCVARVTTKPAGAAVFWGDTALGSSPIRNAAVPCGTATRDASARAL